MKMKQIVLPKKYQKRHDAMVQHAATLADVEIRIKKVRDEALAAGVDPELVKVYLDKVTRDIERHRDGL